MKSKSQKIVILGASGYTGAELLRLLLRHPFAEIVAITADRHRGESVSAVFPHLSNAKLPVLQALEELDWEAQSPDLIFCALPHGLTHATVKELWEKLPSTTRFIDLSADFRLKDSAIYQEWYEVEHAAPELQQSAIYGLTEQAREEIKASRLVACPGCYPTSSLLPLSPLLEEKLIDPHTLIIDSKSGATGAGRGLKRASLFPEVADGFHAYGIGRHRHMPEIEQGLSNAAGEEVTIRFTPHLVPMNRGILSTIYVALSNSASSADDLRACLEKRYGDEKFIRILPAGQLPATRNVRGSNICEIGVFPDHKSGHAILVSAIDNLVKGASGQAVQNMNVMCGYPEDLGLEAVPLFP